MFPFFANSTSVSSRSPMKTVRAESNEILRWKQWFVSLMDEAGQGQSITHSRWMISSSGLFGFPTTIGL